ncbi:hypothetical protein F5Y19DRAFT_280208 [Xylariaceae sp. FL1651]|nr:hypothetical protein F5Y19DRAFT_280208 [Xylariaceae sp. FL1651]
MCPYHLTGSRTGFRTFQRFFVLLFFLILSSYYVLATMREASLINQTRLMGLRLSNHYICYILSLVRFDRSTYCWIIRQACTTINYLHILIRLYLRPLVICLSDELSCIFNACYLLPPE